MQNWQKYILKQALKFSICVHQKDDEIKYYPYKQKFDSKYYTSKIEQLETEIRQLQSSPQNFKDLYENEIKNIIELHETQKLNLKSKIIEDSKSLREIQRLEVEDNTFKIIKSSCLSNLKKSILDNEQRYKALTSDDKQEKFGIWIQKKLQDAKYSLDCFNNMFEQYKMRIAQQNKAIDNLYKILGLKAQDYYKVEIQQ